MMRLFALAISIFVSTGLSPAAAQPVCTPISNAAELQAISNDPAGTYCLTQDIDLASIDNFAPIPTFSGKLFGGGYAIRNLRIRCTEETFDPGNSLDKGLFGRIAGGTVEDLALEDVNIDLSDYEMEGCYSVKVGALAGTIRSNSEQPSTISRVYSTGNLRGYCPSDVGGLAGLAYHLTITDSWSSAKVVSCGDDNAAHGHAGGLVGLGGPTIIRSFTTGRIRGSNRTHTGGLIGTALSATISQSFAAGVVSGGHSGGLVGTSGGATISQSFSLGWKGWGLIGYSYSRGSATVTQSYATGPLFAGLMPRRVGTATASYWDIDTSGLPEGERRVGTGLHTAEFQRRLPPGFAPDVWRITPNRSYPFIPGMAFIGPLSTVVRNSRVFVFLPLDQHRVSDYQTAPMHADEASKAAAFTIIARAIGTTRGIDDLEDAKIDEPFWDDAAQEARFEGPVRRYAVLGTLTTLPAARPLGDNVVSLMDESKLVLLRGSYRKQDKSFGTHWLLGTLYRRHSDGSLAGVVALDPWTGRQVIIDPTTKGVRLPTGFPLRNFRVDAYQPVTLR